MVLQNTTIAVSTTNPCCLCTPFGACLAFRGIEGAVPFIHGSQGCATYIRRYLIGHFREPVDIACSNFSESSAVFGGESNLHRGLANVMQQYRPSLIGIATTCLAETIGDDVPLFLKQFCAKHEGTPLPELVWASTASYRGSHLDGFHAALRACVETLAQAGATNSMVLVLGNMLSPEDLRYLKQVLLDFELPGAILPDYSDTLDGPQWDNYEIIPPGGTCIEAIRRSGAAQAVVEMSQTVPSELSAGKFLEEKFQVPHYPLGIPIGLTASDGFFQALSDIAGRPMPARHAATRGRLLDALVDGHKYVFEKRALVYGEEDLVIALAAFLAEIGIKPVICATGGKRPGFKTTLLQQLGDASSDVDVLTDTDFADLLEKARAAEVDLLVGNSNGAKLARTLKVPLVRVGMPIHDRLGAARVLHVGYDGALQLYDRVVNALIEQKQESSPVGYTHM